LSLTATDIQVLSGLAALISVMAGYFGYRRGRSNDFRVPFCTGILVTLIGAYSDAYYHLEGFAATEGFFTPAHGVLYTGVLIIAFSIFLLREKRLVLPIEIGQRAQNVMFFGILIMLGGAVWDFIYHSINGFIDVVAWTPPHLTVTAGFIVLLSAGIVTFWNKSGSMVKASLGSSVALFAALWITVLWLTL